MKVTELHEQYENIYAEVDELTKASCNKCGACCEYYSQTVSHAEIVNIITNVDVKKFFRTVKRLKDSVELMYRCPFLTEEGCGIYEVRPLVCRCFSSNECEKLLEYKNEREAALLDANKLSKFVLKDVEATRLPEMIQTFPDDLLKRIQKLSTTEIDDEIVKKVLSAPAFLPNAFFHGNDFKNSLPDYDAVWVELQERLAE
jgi:Fe-S-cluster containining protein